MEGKKSLQLIGKNILRLLKEKKMTHAELCKKTSIRLLMLREIEKGKINIRYFTVVKIAEAFQINMAELLEKNKARCD